LQGFTRSEKKSVEDFAAFWGYAKRFDEMRQVV
jgi:hypothetical protein